MPHTALENWEVLETEQNKNKPEEPRHTLENKDFSTVMERYESHISRAIFHFIFYFSSYFKYINVYLLLLPRGLQ